MSGDLDPLAALAESRLADLWETTLTLLERGKAEDDANNGSAAVLLYSEAVGGLQALLELEENEKRLVHDLREGADPSMPSDTGHSDQRTPMHVAVDRMLPRMLEVLL